MMYVKVAMAAALTLVVSSLPVSGETQTQKPPTQAPAPQKPPTGLGVAPAVPAGVAVPADYVIGPEDVLSIVFWRDEDMTREVVVRPDGMITLPLVNDVKAVGLTPEQLRDVVMKASAKFIEDPNVTVVVKAINSRKVFITGMVGKQGAYPLTGPTTVLQLISLAGGVQEFANGKNIVIVRNENGREVPYKFNYNDVKKGKNLKQNILLKPGDQVIVP